MEYFRQWLNNLSISVKEPTFVKVGANDGITCDPCSDILIGKKWKGLLIEPVPHCFKRLKTNFTDTKRFIFEQIAIGPCRKEAIIYHVDEKTRCLLNYPEWVDGLGSFSKNHVLKHLIPEQIIVECKVEVYPLSEVLKKHNIQYMHLLHIDAEGYDYEVLKTLDLDTQAPLSIFIEHDHLSTEDKTEMRNLLHERGYSIRDCGSDYFAVKS